MYYINSKQYGDVETVDQFETYREAREMIREYRLAYPAGYSLYLSQRSTKDWRDSQ